MTKILIINKVGNLMEVKANVNGDLDLYHVNLVDKAKILEQLVTSNQNYKTKAIVLGHFNQDGEIA
jgi:hypothetical protein